MATRANKASHLTGRHDGFQGIAFLAAGPQVNAVVRFQVRIRWPTIENAGEAGCSCPASRMSGVGNRQTHRQMVSVFGRERVLSGVFGLCGRGAGRVARHPSLTVLGNVCVPDAATAAALNAHDEEERRGWPSGTFDPMDAGVVRHHRSRSAVAAPTAPSVPHVCPSKAHLPS